MPIPDVAIPDNWLDAWLGHELHMRAEGLATGTISGRKSSFTSVARHAVSQGIEDPAGITKSFMMRYMAEQIAERHGLGAVQHHQNLLSFWRWYAEEYGTVSPMDGIPRPRASSPPPPVLSREALSSILRACSGKAWIDTRDRAIVLLMLESGLRRTEISLLDITDISLTDRTVVVRRGKGGKPRVSVFGDLTAQALHRWIRVRASRQDEIEPALFTNHRHVRVTPSGVGQLLLKLGTRAGVPGLRPHLFRHCWTHYLLEDGVQEHDIMTLAGWSSSRQLGRYGSALAEQRAVAAGRAHQVGKLIRLLHQALLQGTNLALQIPDLDQGVGQPLVDQDVDLLHLAVGPVGQAGHQQGAPCRDS